MRRARVKDICLLEGGIFECVSVPLLPTTHLRATHPLSLIYIDDTAGYIYSQIIFYEALQKGRRKNEVEAETLTHQDWRAQQKLKNDRD